MFQVKNLKLKVKNYNKKIKINDREDIFLIFLRLALRPRPSFFDLAEFAVTAWR